MVIKTHKRKKSSRYRGRRMGTCGTGARKNKRDSGNRGGKGFAGSGKRADHKKTLILKKYGNTYFGKKGVTSRGTKIDKTKKINLYSIEKNIENFIKKGIAKSTSKGIEINLEKNKILGKGEINSKLIITADSASNSAIEKVEKAGGKIIIKDLKKEKNKSKKEENKNSSKNE